MEQLTETYSVAVVSIIRLTVLLNLTNQDVTCMLVAMFPVSSDSSYSHFTHSTSSS